MADELLDYEEQLNDIVGSIEKCLQNEVSKLIGPARIEKCEYLKNRISRAKQLIKSINVEMRELANDKRGPWVEKVKAFDDRVAKVQQDVNWAITSAERDPSGSGPKTKNADEMTAKEVTSTAKDIQNQSLQSTARAKSAIATTIQIGTETMDVLKQQTDQIKGLDEKIDQVESNLKRADKQLRAFVRRMASDKIIMLLVFLIVLGILGAILASVFGNSKLGRTVTSAVSALGNIQVISTTSKSVTTILIPAPV